MSMGLKRYLRKGVIGYYEHILIYDIMVSFVISIILLSLAGNYFSDNIGTFANSFFATTASVSATLLGFIIAAITILLALFNKETFPMKRFSPRARHTLFDQAYVVSFFLFVTTLLSIAGILLPNDSRLVFEATIVLLIISIISLYHTMTFLRWSICMAHNREPWLFKEKKGGDPKEDIELNGRPA